MEQVVIPVVDPPFQKNLELEKFDYIYWREWMSEHWWWSLVFAGMYVLGIFWGQRVMKERKPMKLKRALLIWNVLLATYSITSVVRTLPDLLVILWGTNGVHNSICSRNQMTLTHVFWEFVGTWSKVAELGDTFFVVVRKQPLNFLHWYHHASVLIYTWFAIDIADPAHRYYMTMNTGIHAVMYTYYALKSIGVNIPRRFALVITSAQILQMFVGLFLNMYTVYAKSSGLDCTRRNSNVIFALLMYGSYLVLFMHFFYKTYLSKKGRKAKSS